MAYGPLHLVVLGFDKPNFEGWVADELNFLREAGIIRLIDALAVYKSAEGDVVALQETDLGLEERIAVAGVIGGLLGFGMAGREGAELGALGRMAFVAENEYGLNDDDIADIADALAPDSAALILLFEHTWAADLKQAVADAGGFVVAQGVLNAQTLIGLGMDMAGDE